ncbi:MAG: 4Fe-4S dicluster domain-containing protein, partial [bacterium]
VLEASPTGAGVVLLTETVGSPSYKAQIKRFLDKYKAARWVQWDPANRDSVHTGLHAVYGKDVSARYDFAKADLVLSVDADFLTQGPGNVRYSRDFMARRHPSHPAGLNRLYSVECAPTNTGVVADHRARLKASAMPAFLRALATKLGVSGVSSGTPGVEAKFFDTLVADLQKAGSKAVVVVGDQALPECHALAALINQQISSQAFIVGEPLLADQTEQAPALYDLVTKMDSGQVSALIMLGGNPVYDAPADLGFAARLAKVKLSVHVCREMDETSKSVEWALPLSHPLESWGDTVAFDGTVAVRQPAILPLFDTKSEIEFLDSLIGTLRDGQDIVQQTFRDAHPAGDWVEYLATGIAPAAKPTAPVAAAPAPATPPAVQPTTAGQVAVPVVPAPAVPAPATFAANSAGLATLGAANPNNGLELVFAPDPNIHDGRFANNSWLQELPKPMSMLVWDNALYVSHKTALQLGIEIQKRFAGIPIVGGVDRLVLTVDGRTLDVPVWVNLGQADDVLYLTLGGGRTVGGDVAVSGDEGHGGGFNAYAVRGSKGLWVQGGVQAARSTKPGYKLVSTQYHNMLESSRVDADREIIFETTPEALASKKEIFPKHEWMKEEGEAPRFGAGVKDPKDAGQKKNAPPSWYEDDDFNYSDTNYQWAMTIDLSLCTGCNACITACQSENSIITVGKEQASKHRAMHWIRVDRYYMGRWKEGDQGLQIDTDNPPVYFQPVTCMQCENAPCEPVCPVAATTHSHEGINQMVYNRCVGTRYCSNNCPYKVRRFNFLDYTARVSQVPILRMLQNPEVTLRGRGVMEKCTYCVQRINKVRQAHKVDGTPDEIKDGEIKTACQVACPGRAIVFGDRRKPENAVAKTIRDPRNYVLLEELNTRPRTTYLCRVTNPNPALARGEKA